MIRMLKHKIELTTELRKFIKDEREKSNIKIADLTEAVGKTRQWLSQIETGRAKFITKVDLIKIVSTIKGLSDSESETYIESNVSFKNIYPTFESLHSYEYIDDVPQKIAPKWFEDEEITNNFSLELANTDAEIDTSFEKKISEFIKTFTNEFKKLSKLQKLICTKAISNLTSCMSNDSELTTLLMSIPIDAFILPENERKKTDVFIKLKSLYYDCEHIRILNEKPKLIEKNLEMKEILESIEKDRLKVIYKTILMNIDNISKNYEENWKQMDFVCNAIEVTIFEPLNQIVQLAEQPSLDKPNSPMYLCELLSICIDGYNYICASYGLEPIPDKYTYISNLEEILFHS